MSRFRSDEGVYAILYAALMVVLFGMAALVVDIAQLRADKRDDRSVADTAALAGARDLGSGPWTPRAACESAWDYLLQSLALNAPTSSPCSTGGSTGNGFPVSTNSCPAADTVKGAANGVTIGVTWPVPQGHTALTNPDGLSSGSAPRPFDPTFDGTIAGCDRLAVTVLRERTLGLGAAFGITDGRSAAQSVARFVDEDSPGDIPFPLVLLDPHSCVVLSINGGTKVLITNNGNSGGHVGIDSDGAYSGGPPPDGDTNLRACSGGPTNANGVIINAGATNDSIWAQDALGDPGTIEIYGPLTLPVNAAAPSGQSTCASITAACIAPVPIVRPERITRSPFDRTYNCGTTCTGGSASTAYIDRVGLLGNITNASSGWTVINNTSTPKCNDNGPGLLTGSKIFIDCGGSWTVNGNWIMPQGATVIVNGTLNVKGCFGMNAHALTLANPCASPYAPSETPVPSLLTTNAILSVRGDIASNGSAGKMVLPRTFVHQPGTTSRFNGSGFDVISWTAPYVLKTAMATQCPAGQDPLTVPPADCFRNLALWTETPSTESSPANIISAAELKMEGTYFLGNAKLKLSGNSGINVTASQFVAKRIEARGGSTLLFIPNPERTTGINKPKVSLVR